MTVFSFYTQKIGFFSTLTHYALESSLDTVEKIIQQPLIYILIASGLKLRISLPLLKKTVSHFSPIVSKQSLNKFALCLYTLTILLCITLTFFSILALHNLTQGPLRELKKALADKLKHETEIVIDVMCKSGDFSRKEQTLRAYKRILSLRTEMSTAPKRFFSTKYSQEAYENLLEFFPNEIEWKEILKKKNIPLQKAAIKLQFFAHVNFQNNNNISILLCELDNLLNFIPLDNDVKEHIEDLLKACGQNSLKVLEALGQEKGHRRLIYPNLQKFLVQLQPEAKKAEQDLEEAYFELTNTASSQEQLTDKIQKIKSFYEEHKITYSIISDFLPKLDNHPTKSLTFLVKTLEKLEELKPPVICSLWAKITSTNPTLEAFFLDEELFPDFENVSTSLWGISIFIKFEQLLVKDREKEEPHLKSLIEKFGKRKFKKALNQRKQKHIKLPNLESFLNSI